MAIGSDRPGRVRPDEVADDRVASATVEREALARPVEHQTTYDRPGRPGTAQYERLRDHDVVHRIVTYRKGIRR